MRERIRKDMLTLPINGTTSGRRFRAEAVLIGVVHNPQLLPLQGKTLAEIARIWNKDPMTLSSTC